MNKSKKAKCPVSRGDCRVGVFAVDGGSVSLCSSQKDDVRSKRVFARQVSAYGSLLTHIKEFRDKLTNEYSNQHKRMRHNLASLNAHAIQDIYDLVSQEALAKHYSEQLRTIQGTLRDQPDKAARTILRIAKNNLAVKSEFASLRFLDGTDLCLQIRTHSIHKVLLNVLHVFLPDFLDRDIAVTVYESFEEARFDYDMFHCALFHILDNATKYAMQGTELSIDFERDNNDLKVSFEMLSLPILPDEVLRIGEEGFSGSRPRSLGLAGYGLGMNLAARLLSANNGKLVTEANADPNRAQVCAGVEYHLNRFTIVLYGN